MDDSTPDSQSPDKVPRAPASDFIVALDKMFEGLQVIDREWRYLYLNDIAALHGRRPKQELLGNTMMTAYPGIDETPMFRALERAMYEGQPQKLTNEFEYEDGTKGWFELRVCPVETGIVILSVDVTEEKRRELALAESRDEIAAILNGLSEAVLTTDVSGSVARMNPFAERLLGSASSEVRGQPLASVLSLWAEHSGELLRFEHDRIPIGRMLVQNSEGVSIPVVTSAETLVDSQGEVRGSVVVLRDVSAERELEERLRHSQKMEAVGRLAGTVAHDFNNMLTAILSFTQFARDSLPTGHGSISDLDEVLRAAQRATDLTRQLLMFSRRQPIRPTHLDVSEAVASTTPLLRRLIGDQITLSSDLASDLWTVWIDAGALEQVIVNLVINARDAMDAGGRLDIETANRTLAANRARATPAGEYVRLCVRDDGVGIEPHQLTEIFEPFFTTKPAGVGTGLGLSTCHGIVSQAGGHISVSSKPGEGTTFEVYLPRSDGSEPASSPESA